MQEKARRALYPGDTQEMVEILTELKFHGDTESQSLARQLEDRLQVRGLSGLGENPFLVHPRYWGLS